MRKSLLKSSLFCITVLGFSSIGCDLQMSQVLINEIFKIAGPSIVDAAVNSMLDDQSASAPTATVPLTSTYSILPPSTTTSSASSSSNLANSQPAMNIPSFSILSDSQPSSYTPTQRVPLSP